MHRFLWDLHYSPVPGSPAGYPMEAVAHDTAPAPTGPWAMPGAYEIRLSIAGLTLTRPLTVKMDPRVNTPASGLEQQFTQSMQMYEGEISAAAAAAQVRGLRKQLQQLQKSAAGQGPVADAVAALDKKAEALAGAEARGFGRFGGGGGPDTFNSIRGTLGLLLARLQGADVAPTTQTAAAVADRQKALAGLLARWAALRSEDLLKLNTQLKQANLPAVTIEPAGASE